MTPPESLVKSNTLLLFCFVISEQIIYIFSTDEIEGDNQARYFKIQEFLFSMETFLKTKIANVFQPAFDKPGTIFRRIGD